MMEFLVTPVMDKPLWMWAGFIGIVIALLAFDLGVLHRKTHEVSIRESLWMSAFYIAIALAFGGWVWWSLGDQAGKEYLTGFIVEKTLALDNVFVISLIFTYFAIPPLYQHRVLFWGILGVIVLRGIMIALGATLVSQYSWVLYVFAVFLIFTGIKMLFVGDKHPDIGNNPLLKLMRRVFPISAGLDGQKFLTRQPDPKTGKWRTYATPLLVALALIEFVDLIFAVDSVPAIFTITLDPFIVFTSNIFAILGLRALYFALAAIIHRFRYLKPALAIVLIFIGSKTFIADAMGLEKFPANISLGVTLGLIAAGVIVSLIKTHKPGGHRP
ncbi:integral membrane protein TerC [Asticcacaulis excentricus]|jgi:tellurite resistance protein TerC|uniref:Integral membrane protein TerC n=2 Tax=Asticcacaulis excentricus TaxID=78587 RepID=A0A3G9FZJ2_9CAUL|nr:integral membrane protein TerC [Asticcacaulis excentricus]